MSNSNNKYKTLVSNTMLISLGTFGSKLLVFFMVRFYTSYLTPADYGTADLITQTANLLFPLISLGITPWITPSSGATFSPSACIRSWRALCYSWPFCRCWGSSHSLTGSSG